MVVVKVLTALGAEATRRRFDRERKAMGRLSQTTGIAPLYGSGFTPTGQPWLLMPYYQRGSLQEVLDTEGPMGAERVRAIGIRVSDAVHVAHENGVLHRDLKPANILVTSGGDPDVADFGIAHLLDDTLGMSQSLTMTPLYTAPEVFDGVDSGAATDIYSIGALLYALATGRPAYSSTGGGATPMLALMRRINEEPLPALPADVPRPLANVIARAMSKEPSKRHSTARELATELRNVDMRAASSRSAVQASSGRRIAVVLVALGVVAIAGLGALFAAGRLGDNTASEGDTTTVTATETPTIDAPTPTVAAESGGVDPTLALAAASQVLVRVEGFSCTGAAVSAGISLGDGRILTREDALDNPWLMSVSNEDQVVAAQPLTRDLNRQLGLVSVASADFGTPRTSVIEADDRVIIVDGEGNHVVVTVTADGDDLLANSLSSAEATEVNTGDAVFNPDGSLVGVLGESDKGRLVIPIATFEQGWNNVAPTTGCTSLRNEIPASAADQVTSPEIAELLQMQQLSNAYASESWEEVRAMEPSKATYSAEQFVDGWRPLRQGFVYPVHRSVDDDGIVSWRIGLIGHETWFGTDLTSLFCVSWQVDRATGEIVQTGDDPVRVFGPLPDDTQQAGFVDPGELIALIDESCPLGP